MSASNSIAKCQVRACDVWPQDYCRAFGDWREPSPLAAHASAIFRRKAIYEELHPETKAGVAGASARWNGKDANENSAFAPSTSDAIGKSRRFVEIANARAEALGDDLAAVTGTSLDKGVELDALAKLPKDELRDRSSQ